LTSAGESIEFAFEASLAKQRSLELLAACGLHATWAAVKRDGRSGNFVKLNTTQVLLELGRDFANLLEEIRKTGTH